MIEEARERLEAYNRADRDEAEELYGDYVDAVETGTEILADIRDAYAPRTRRASRRSRRASTSAEFNRASRSGCRTFALEIENRTRAARRRGGRRNRRAPAPARRVGLVRAADG